MVVRSARVLGVALLLAGATVLTGCGAQGPRDGRGPVSVQSWHLEGGDLVVVLPTCDGEPVVSSTETADSVTVSAVSTTRDPGDACLDAVVVVLTAPLGDRTVLDGRNGAEVPRV